MDSISEIKAKINAFHNDAAWLRLKSRWDKDYELYRLDPYNAGAGYISYTSNAPRVLADKIIHRLTSARLVIHIPEEVLTDEEAKIANNAERFLYGVLNLNDKRLTSVPYMPPLRDQWAWMAVIRGAVAFRVYVYKNKDGETSADIQPWDVYNVAYGMKDGRINWAAHTYYITAREAHDHYGYNVSGSGADIQCIDYWDDKEYGLIVGDTWGVKVTKHDLGHPPVYIIPSGATPLVHQTNYAFGLKHVGESVFAANREIFPVLNKMLSDALTIVRRGVKTPMGVWTEDGENPIDEDIWQVEKGGIIPLRRGDEIRPIMPPTLPADAFAMLNWISGEIQRGGLSHTSYGEVATRLSGYAISQLNDAMETVLVPFAQCISRAYEMACRELLTQYTSREGLKPIAVRGRTSRNEPFGYPKALEIKPSDIKGDWMPEVRLLAVLPSDDAQRYMLARMAREGTIPLLSDETIRGTILGVQDPDLERNKINREWADSLIVNRLWDAYVACLEEGDRDAAANILVELRRFMMEGAVPAPKPQRARERPIDLEATKSPSGGVPLGSTGVPTSVFPPEAGGGMPPGALNARMPPLTEEEV